MLPPVLEIYVVHHPDDHEGGTVARQVFEHFHGTAFSGLIGGAVEVFVRSQPFGGSDAPRPIAFPGSPPLHSVAPARFVAILPVVSLALARAVEGGGSWATYIEDLVAARGREEAHLGVFPMAVGAAVGHDTRLRRILTPIQYIAIPSGLGESEPEAELRGRDLAQGIAQLLLGSGSRLQIFISHTRRPGPGEAGVPELISLVRGIIDDTRLQHFFDARDLQPGRDWSAELVQQTSTSALLALRTDFYASRMWCQREMLTAKRSGMPIVILDSLGRGEERGSFLMDHLPRIPIHGEEDCWSRPDIRRGLSLLVDEALKRAIWTEQKKLAAGIAGLGVAWWAPHAPEPVTLAHWIGREMAAGRVVLGTGDLRILHPDPPLGPDETDSLAEMVRLMGHRGALDIMTPRALSARGA
jgi:hypothetical protein